MVAAAGQQQATPLKGRACPGMLTAWKRQKQKEEHILPSGILAQERNSREYRRLKNTATNSSHPCTHATLHCGVGPAPIKKRNLFLCSLLNLNCSCDFFWPIESNRMTLCDFWAKTYREFCIFLLGTQPLRRETHASYTSGKAMWMKTMAQLKPETNARPVNDIS